MVSVVDALLHLLERFFLWVSALCLVIMVTIIPASVIGRYFFSYPMAWSVEVSEYLMIFMTFFAASWILRHQGHVRVEIILNLIPVRFRKFCEALSLFLGCTVCSILAWFSLEVTINYFQRNIVLLKIFHMPQYIVIFPIFVGSFLLGVRFFIQFLENVISSLRGE